MILKKMLYKDSVSVYSRGVKSSEVWWYEGDFFKDIN